jgi:hypothetical protein
MDIGIIGSGHIPWTNESVRTTPRHLWCAIRNSESRASGDKVRFTVES